MDPGPERSSQRFADRPAGDRRVPAAARGSRQAGHPALALQRLVGNRAAAQLLAREVVPTLAGNYVRLTVGSDVSLPLATMAWTLTEHGPLDDSAIATLRAVALVGDETIDDNERLLMAALLDAGNGRAWHAGDVPLLGTTIAFPAASITAANRHRIQDAGRTAHTELTWPTETGDPAEHAARLDQDIIYLAGPFAQAARDTIALADERHINHIAVYLAMLHGASDSTEGDRAFAGAVYVIARREGLDDVAKLILSGTVKVDEVTRASLGEDVGGMYQPEANARGFKGDTLYLPSDMRFSSLIAQGTVVHELTHAGQEADATSLRVPTVEDSELEAFMAEAGFYLSAVFRRSGDERARAVEEIAKDISLPQMLCMLIWATMAINDDKAIAVVREVHEKVMSVGLLETAHGLSDADLQRFITGLQDEDRHDDFAQALEKRARRAVDKLYRGIGTARERGYVGEGQLDMIDADAPGAKPLQRQPTPLQRQPTPLQRQPTPLQRQPTPLQRQPTHDQAPPAKPPVVDEIELIVGGDITVALAARAKKLAKGKITPEAKRQLHDLALADDDSVSDAERILIAALDDPDNAKRIAELKPEETEHVTLRFPREQSTRDRIHAVADIGRPKRSAKASTEAGAKQEILTLAGGDPLKTKAAKLLAFAADRGVALGEILDAMIAAASDSTAGDQVAAGSIYAIAKAAANPLADDLRAGRIKVDEQRKLSSGTEGVDARALYGPVARDLRREHGPKLLKGDTIYVSGSFDVDSVADRGTAIHELQHAADDKAAAGSPTQRRDIEVEVAGYTAGARYTLQEIARLAAGTGHTKAVHALADTWDARHFVAAVHAARTDASGKEVKDGPLVAVLREVYGALTDKDRKAIEGFAGTLDDNLKADLAELVRTLQGEIMRGTGISAQDMVTLEGLRGESMLDTLPPP